MSRLTSGQLTRREAVRRLGAAAAVSLLTMRAEQEVGAASAQDMEPIVRTVLADVPPASITGATLIHEHLSMNFFGANPAFAFYRDMDLMSDEVRACADAGVSCIVDTGGT